MDITLERAKEIYNTAVTGNGKTDAEIVSFVESQGYSVAGVAQPEN